MKTIKRHLLQTNRKKLPARLATALVVATLLPFLYSPVGAQTVTTGKSYINITRPNGGTFLPGDIIEVRATIAVSGGSNSSGNRVTAVRYNDTINLTKFTYITGSLQMLSNEGRQQYAYLDAADADSANIDLTSGRIRFNIGNSAGAADVLAQAEGITNAGRLWGALRPSFFGSTCIRMYSYRVQIKATPSIVDLDSTILLSAGNFRYRIGSSSTDTRSNFAPYYLKISSDFGLCSNSIGANAIVGEFGGTFGSGSTQNRAGGTSFVPPPYTFQNFSSGAPNDNYYGLANRTSSDGTINPNVPYSSGAGSGSRVFNVWDIIGDHTGASDPAKGNLPSTTGGYTVVINASYQTNLAFTQDISGLCEETYYEFSAWFRNICRRCGCDSSGKGAGSSGYVPAPGSDSSGVRPNLSFQIDGVDYYTSGNIPYSGDWLKKGFVFRTKPGQTSIKVTIRNNAPGGGGNDWAIDDIAVATCLPNLQYSPSISPTVCAGAAYTITSTVRSYFDNYTHYKWQRSVDAGITWLDVTSPATPGTAPVWNGTAWEFSTSYTIPPSLTALGNTGDMYRLVVATSVLNLLNVTCRSTEASTIVTLGIINCNPVLTTRITSFTGKVIDGKASLRWTTDNNENAIFDIERSLDGINFIKAGAINSTAGERIYTFTDPQRISDKAYYRIATRNAGNGSATYTSVIQLNSSAIAGFTFAKVINPFTDELVYTVNSEWPARAKAMLLDQFGKLIRVKAIDITTGVNQFSFDETSGLATGMYILRVETPETSVYKQVIKGRK